MIYYLARDRRVIPNSFDHQPAEIKEAINSFIDGLISFAHANGTSFYVRDLVGKKVYPNGWSGIPLDAIYHIAYKVVPTSALSIADAAYTIAPFSCVAQPSKV